MAVTDNAATGGADPDEQPPDALIEATTALLAAVTAITLPLDLATAEPARRARTEIEHILNAAILPRLRTPDAPLLCALAGPTGVGKSTLLNALAGATVSATGPLRPTTRTPVLVCNPADLGGGVSADVGEDGSGDAEELRGPDGGNVAGREGAGPLGELADGDEAGSDEAGSGLAENANALGPPPSPTQLVPVEEALPAEAPVLPERPGTQLTADESVPATGAMAADAPLVPADVSVPAEEPAIRGESRSEAAQTEAHHGSGAAAQAEADREHGAADPGEADREHGTASQAKADREHGAADRGEADREHGAAGQTEADREHGTADRAKADRERGAADRAETDREHGTAGQAEADRQRGAASQTEDDRERGTADRAEADREHGTAGQAEADRERGAADRADANRGHGAAGLGARVGSELASLLSSPLPSPSLPRGVALVDTVDGDVAVVGAADVVVVVVSAERYADAAVWRVLRRVLASGAPIVVVLGRVSVEVAEEVAAAFVELLRVNGLGAVPFFVVEEVRGGQAGTQHGSQSEAHSRPQNMVLGVSQGAGDTQQPGGGSEPGTAQRDERGLGDAEQGIEQAGGGSGPAAELGGDGAARDAGSAGAAVSAGGDGGVGTGVGVGEKGARARGAVLGGSGALGVDGGQGESGAGVGGGAPGEGGYGDGGPERSGPAGETGIGAAGGSAWGPGSGGESGPGSGGGSDPGSGGEPGPGSGLGSGSGAGAGVGVRMGALGESGAGARGGAEAPSRSAPVVVDETPLVPEAAVAGLRGWLRDAGADTAGRGRIGMLGVAGRLDSVDRLVGELADAWEGQRLALQVLHQGLERVHTAERVRFRGAVDGGELLGGEVRIRWQELLGSGRVSALFEAEDAGRKRKRRKKAEPDWSARFHNPAAHDATTAPLRAALVEAVARGYRAALERAARKTVDQWELTPGAPEPGPVDDATRRATDPARAAAEWLDHLPTLILDQGHSRRTTRTIGPAGAHIRSAALVLGVAALAGNETGNGEADPAATAAQGLLRTMFGHEDADRLLTTATTALKDGNARLLDRACEPHHTQLAAYTLDPRQAQALAEARAAVARARNEGD
ncbi:GTPase [Catenulispora sp. EB89]|uniref:GTPase n=1 Tax=Catenulispora sp. EB89 TaxID=3156257 RepID=UPI00351336F6